MPQSRCLLPLFLTLTLCISGSQVGAEIHEAQVLTYGSWDFSAGNCGCPPCDTGCGYLWLYDVYIVFVFDPPLGWRVGGRVKRIESTAIESITSISADGFENGVPFETNAVYAVITKEENYALVRYLDDAAQPGILRMEYRYQDDGSTNFDASVPVEQVSWGRVKGMSRTEEGNR